jgi:hypothetical protein
MAGVIYAVTWPCLGLVSLARRDGAVDDAVRRPKYFGIWLVRDFEDPSEAS